MKRLSVFIFCTLCIITGSVAQVSYTGDTTCYVQVTYSDNVATIVVSTDIKDYITAEVSGGDVTISSTASATVNEITYGLYGSTSDGSFTLVGTYKATMELFGVSISNPSGPAIDIQNGKRVEISSKSGTISTLRDGTSTATDAWKGALQSKGHLEFKGRGILNVYGNYKHAIRAGEYIEVRNCTINVYSAVKDAINCNQYFAMESGEINLSGFGDDGIQVSLKTDDTSVENTGDFTLSGGTININSTGATGESIKADGTQSVASVASLNMTTGVDEVQGDMWRVRKVLHDGLLLIERGGKRYTITGNEIQL